MDLRKSHKSNFLLASSGLLNRTGGKDGFLEDGSQVNLGASKTRSGFNLFTHQAQRKDGGGVKYDYASLR